MVMEGVRWVGRITELERRGARAAGARYGIHRLAYLVEYHCAKRVTDPHWTCARGLWRSGPLRSSRARSSLRDGEIENARRRRPNLLRLPACLGRPL